MKRVTINLEDDLVAEVESRAEEETIRRGKKVWPANWIREAVELRLEAERDRERDL